MIFIYYILVNDYCHRKTRLYSPNCREESGRGIRFRDVSGWIPLGNIQIFNGQMLE